jgi:hypothetical protein
MIKHIKILYNINHVLITYNFKISQYIDVNIYIKNVIH